MNSYQVSLGETQAAYAAVYLPSQNVGADGYRLNLLSGIRARFWQWLDAVNPTVELQEGFHRLDASQAMAFNLFFPFMDTSTQRVDARLLKCLGLPPVLEYHGAFQKVLEEEEGTRFDFYLEEVGGQKIFLNLKLAETTFGSCENDPEHRRIFDRDCRTVLGDHVDAEWLRDETFWKHDQILRHVAYLVRYPDSGLVFIYPKANESLSESDNVIKRIVSKSLAPRVAILYLEPLVTRIFEATAGDAALHAHFVQFREKYLIPPRG